MASLRDPLDLDFSDLDPNGGSYADRAARARAAGAKPSPAPDFVNNPDNLPDPPQVSGAVVEPEAPTKGGRFAKFRGSTADLGRRGLRSTGKVLGGLGLAATAGLEAHDAYADSQAPGMTTLDKAARAAEGAGRFGGTVAGAITGAELGAPLAPATFGLSIPAGAVIGGLLGHNAVDYAKDAYNYIGKKTGLYEPIQLGSETAAADRAAHPNVHAPLPFSASIPNAITHSGTLRNPSAVPTTTTPAVNVAPTAAANAINATRQPDGTYAFSGQDVGPNAMLTGDTRGLRGGTVSVVPSTFTADTARLNAGIQGELDAGDFEAARRLAATPEQMAAVDSAQGLHNLAESAAGGDRAAAFELQTRLAQQTARAGLAGKLALARYNMLPKLAQLRIDELKADQAQRNADRSYKLQARGAQAKTNDAAITSFFGKTGPDGKVTPESQADMDQFRVFVENGLAPAGLQINDVPADELQRWMQLYTGKKRVDANHATLLSKIRQFVGAQSGFTPSSNPRDYIPNAPGSPGIFGKYTNAPVGQYSNSVFAGGSEFLPPSLGGGDPDPEFLNLLRKITPSRGMRRGG